MANRWTKEQKQAIDARGSDLLIAAAAGSGKTAVLVERIITKLLREEQEIDRLLVVTFTNAAAFEMRQRIGVRLRSSWRKRPKISICKTRWRFCQGQISRPSMPSACR